MPSQANSSSAVKSKDTEAVLAETEQQWLYTEDELLRTPSIVAGMSVEEERTLRTKGVNFILQVGVMLKLPQTTLTTAAVFFNRFLMRYSLVAKDGLRPLHHYQIAAVSIFVATKVEEHSRKLKEIVIACCRVAQKNPGLLVDEQTKDFWRWKDTIVLNEDLMLEHLCFDLTLESPYTYLYNMMKHHDVATNKKLRENAWSFINDSGMTQLSLLFPARTIACAALYCGAKFAGVSIQDDSKGRAWWEAHNVKAVELKRAYNHMIMLFELSPPTKPGQDNIYAGGQTPLSGDRSTTRIKREVPSDTPMTGSESPKKRPREDSFSQSNGKSSVDTPKKESRIPAAALAVRDDRSAEDNLTATGQNGQKADVVMAEGSEDGEVEE